MRTTTGLDEKIVVKSAEDARRLGELLAPWR